jgi:hypothetical protein
MLGEKLPAVGTAVGERLDTDEVRAFCRARLATRDALELVVIGAAALPRNAVREVQVWPLAPPVRS